MQDPFIVALTGALSADRLASYRWSGDDDAGMLGTYLWNLTLCEALYPGLQALEVALRNRLFDAGAAAFPVGRYADVPCWLDAVPPILHPAEHAKVRLAVQQLRRGGKPLDPGHLVPELTFGFWTALLDVRYEHRQVLWPWLLSRVFPDVPPARRTRKNISAVLNRIRHLRNRAFHHEPVWHWRDLRGQHATILEVIGWMCPELRDTVAVVDRFRAIHARGRSGLRGTVETLCVARVPVTGAGVAGEIGAALTAGGGAG